MKTTKIWEDWGMTEEQYLKETMMLWKRWGRFETEEGNKKLELENLMKECKMNESTIKGVLRLLKTEEEMQMTIDYINKFKEIINDHQLRQYMMEILVWDKE